MSIRQRLSDLANDGRNRLTDEDALDLLGLIGAVAVVAEEYSLGVEPMDECEKRLWETFKAVAFKAVTDD